MSSGKPLVFQGFLPSSTKESTGIHTPVDSFSVYRIIHFNSTLWRRKPARLCHPFPDGHPPADSLPPQNPNADPLSKPSGQTESGSGTKLDDEEVYIQLRSSEHYEPERAAIANEGYQRIIDTIENLKPVWRDVVKMHFLEERSYTEISEALGITEDVCRSRISRARKYLEAELKDMLE